MNLWQSILADRMAHDVPQSAALKAWHLFRLGHANDIAGGGNLHPATLVGGPVLDGALGLPLDGATQYARLGNAADLSPGAGDMTVYLRFSTVAAAGTTYLWSKYGTTGTHIVSLRIGATGGMTGALRGSANRLVTLLYLTPPTGARNNGAGHTAAVVKSGTDFKLYVDGALAHAVSDALFGSLLLDNAAEPWAVGAFKAFGGAYSFWFPGNIATRLQWNVALAPAEIATAHAGGY